MLWAGLIALILAAVAATQMVPWYDLVDSGYRLMMGSAGIGIPVEIVYFTLVWRALKRDGPAPQGWYWRSYLHHGRLDRGQRRWVLPWFYVGIVAFTGISLGSGVVVLGFIAAARQS